MLSTDNNTISNFDPSILNIHDLYWKGKSATETFLIIVPVFLFVLVLIGNLLSKKKKIKLPSISEVKKVVILAPIFLTAFITRVNAMCPVCTIAIGAGLGLSRLLGIDDFITSIWMGGLVVSTVNWILSWLEKRKIKSTKATIITYVVMYALVIFPLQIAGTIGVKGNIMFGIDKVLLGIIIGSIFFVIGMLVNNYLKARNGNKVKIPFQKVVFPISFLWLATIMGYFIIYYYLV